MKKKIIAGILAIATMATCAFTVVACKENKETEQAGTSLTQTMTDGGMQVGNVHSNGIKLMSATLLSSEYDEYGVAATAESAYTLTATITPEYASNKAVDWSVAWVNSSSSWANGKKASDYVKVSPSSDGALTATVSCLSAFGEQVKIVVSSRDNSSITAECICDYAQRINSFASISIANSTSSAGTFLNTFNSTSSTATPTTVITAENNYSAYTVEDTFTYTATMRINDAFVSAVTAQGFTCTQDANTYFSFGTSGNFGLSAISNPALVLQGQRKSQYITAMQSLGTGAQIGDVKVVAQGTYSTYEQVFPIVLDASCTEVAVSSLAVDSTSFTF